MIFPIDLPIIGSTSLLSLAGISIMFITTVLFIISFISLLNNCGKTGFVDNNADSLIILSVILDVVGFMMIMIGVNL